METFLGRRLYALLGRAPCRVHVRHKARTCRKKRGVRQLGPRADAPVGRCVSTALVNTACVYLLFRLGLLAPPGSRGWRPAMLPGHVLDTVPAFKYSAALPARAGQRKIGQRRRATRRRRGGEHAPSAWLNMQRETRCKCWCE